MFILFLIPVLKFIQLPRHLRKTFSLSWNNSANELIIPICCYEMLLSLSQLLCLLLHVQPNVCCRWTSSYHSFNKPVWWKALEEKKIHSKKALLEFGFKICQHELSPSEPTQKLIKYTSLPWKSSKHNLLFISQKQAA